MRIVRIVQSYFQNSIIQIIQYCWKYTTSMFFRVMKYFTNPMRLGGPWGCRWQVAAKMGERFDTQMGLEKWLVKERCDFATGLRRELVSRAMVVSCCTCVVSMSIFRIEWRATTWYYFGHCFCIGLNSIQHRPWVCWIGETSVSFSISPWLRFRRGCGKNVGVSWISIALDPAHHQGKAHGEPQRLCFF